MQLQVQLQRIGSATGLLVVNYARLSSVTVSDVGFHEGDYLGQYLRLHRELVSDLLVNAVLF